MDACCFREGSPRPTFSTVRVVHLDGFVEDFEPPTTVIRVIGIFQKYFVTSPIRIMQFGLVPLKLDTQLEPGRIYFLLPNSILRFNESSDNLICLTRKLTHIAKTHRPVTKPPSSSARLSHTKPAISASRSIPKTIPSASPSMALQDPSPNRSMAKPPPSPNRSKNKPPSSASSSREKRSSKISLTKTLSNIAKNHISVSQQDKGSSENSDQGCSNVENNNHKNNSLSARRRAFAWKPLLSTVREISFNRRESDLRDD